MLLDRINDEGIAALLEKFGDQPDFDPERYNLFFQYDTAAGAMIYMAVRKSPTFGAIPPEDLPLGYWFSIGADLIVHPGGTFPWLPLLLYLREMEKGLPEEDQKKLYGEAYYTLGSVAGLSPLEMVERETVRRSFLSFLESLDRGGLLSEKKAEEQALTLQIELLELPDRTRPLAMRLKVRRADGKTCHIPNALAFFRALGSGGELTLRPRFSVHLSPDAFVADWQPLMSHFGEHVHASTSSGRVSFFLVSSNHLPAFFALLPKAAPDPILVSDQGAWTLREEESPATVRLDSAGSLTLYPTPPENKTEVRVFISGKQMVLLNTAHRKILLYHFEDAVSAELYGYFAGRTQKEVSYVSDLLIQKVLPASSGLLRKSANNDFRISVYISLEGNSLLFRTEYQVGEEKKDPSFFEGKPFEQALIRSCDSVLASLHGTANGRISDPEDLLFFLRGDLAPLRQVASVYLDDQLKRLNIRNAPALQIRACQARGWLSLSFHSREYTEEELEAIYAAYRKKKRFFLLKNDLILLEPKQMAPVEAILEESGAGKHLSDLQLPFYHAMLLEGYKEAGLEISMDEAVRKAVADVIGYKSAKPRLSPALKKILRPYQTDGVKWLKRLSQYGFSGILADDMGLGKTLQVLAFLASSDPKKPVLIVCPKSLVYNWRNEIQKWLGDVPVVLITGSRDARLELIRSLPESGGTICITGYESLRADIDAYLEKSFFLVLADEAQNIKNASTQKAKAIRKISSDMRLALTGTPVENALVDLWSIFDFLMPGYLGSEAAFREKYESDSSPDNARAMLARKVAPFLLRRSKKDVLDNLPPKEVVQITVSMEDRQRDLYEAYLHKARELARTEKGVSVFAALTRLRQICVDPSVFLEDYDEMSAKLSVALDQVISSIEGGHRVLVFSAFTRVLEHFRYYLEEKDIRSYTISGDTPGSLRVEMAEKFNTEDRVKVMLVSVKAGGTGLNLIGADIVIHLDPWWNFAVEEQATDRAYRIGQTKPVTVYKLIAHDSIEEKVVSLQEAKRQASDDVVQTSASGIDSLSQDDIRFILQ